MQVKGTTPHMVVGNQILTNVSMSNVQKSNVIIILNLADPPMVINLANFYINLYMVFSLKGKKLGNHINLYILVSLKGKKLGNQIKHPS